MTVDVVTKLTFAAKISCGSHDHVTIHLSIVMTYRPRRAFGGYNDPTANGIVAYRSRFRPAWITGALVARKAYQYWPTIASGLAAGYSYLRNRYSSSGVSRATRHGRFGRYRRYRRRYRRRY